MLLRGARLVLATRPHRDPEAARGQTQGHCPQEGEGAAEAALARAGRGPQTHQRADGAVPGGAERPCGGDRHRSADRRLPRQTPHPALHPRQNRHGRRHPDRRGRRK